MSETPSLQDILNHASKHGELREKLVSFCREMNATVQQDMFATKDAELARPPFFRIVHGASPKLLLHRDPALHQPVAGS